MRVLGQPGSSGFLGSSAVSAHRPGPGETIGYRIHIDKGRTLWVKVRRLRH